MRKFLLLGVLFGAWIGTNQTAQAVQVNPKGLGEVLIYPYYTVNNDLNTLYSIVNTTDQPKAIKVRFLEGDIGRDVLIFNVYLAPYDVWTGALVPTTSTVAGHIGEDSALHVTAEQSCAPFLVRSGQEFLPFLVDLDSGNNDMQRSRHGYMEVLEMGVVTGEAAQAVVHGEFGLTDDCDLLEDDWADNGEWDFDSLDEPSGGLMGSATLVNVAEGLAMSYDAIALQNFWQGAGIHTDPGSESPNLSDASPESRVLLGNGDVADSEWSNGYEAVSAVLMNQSVMNEYAFDQIVDGKTEWVLTFPTKRYHTTSGFPVAPPFRFPWDGWYSCDEFSIAIYDRSVRIDFATVGGGIRPPITPPPSTCFASNVFEFIRAGSNAHVTSEVLGTQNHLTFEGPEGDPPTTENGWARVVYASSTQKMEPDSGVGFLGLPVTGFAVQQFTNANASFGLLAQYGNIFSHKYQVVTDE